MYENYRKSINKSLKNDPSCNALHYKRSGFTTGFVKHILLVAVITSISACTQNIKSDKASDYNSDLGIQYLQKGRLNLANEKLLKSLEQNPDSEKPNHYYALLQERLGNVELADKHFKKAIEAAPDTPEIRNNYGSFLCKNKRPQAAVKQFLIAVKNPLYRTPEFAYTNAGICLRKTNNDALAENYFRLALKKKSSFPSALLEMGKLYFDRKSYARAQGFMLRYENVGTSSPEALELCVGINNKMGNHTKAASCKSALLRLFPSSPEAERLN